MNGHNPKDTVSPDDFDDPEEYMKWLVRLDAAVKHLEYPYFRTMTNQSGRYIHLPPEFPNEDAHYAINEKLDGVKALCGRNQHHPTYVVKDPTVFPPGSSNVCSFCMAKFVRWWNAMSLRPSMDDPRPEVDV